MVDERPSRKRTGRSEFQCWKQRSFIKERKDWRGQEATGNDAIGRLMKVLRLSIVSLKKVNLAHEVRIRTNRRKA